MKSMVSVSSLIAAGDRVCELVPEVESSFGLLVAVDGFETEVGAAIIVFAVIKLCPEYKERFDELVAG